MEKKGIITMFGAACFACTGQLLWKISSNANIFLILLGFILYSFGAGLMILSYRFGSVSILQPILSINYALSLILGAIVLNEKISIKAVFGILLISFGVILIVRENA